MVGSSCIGFLLCLVVVIAFLSMKIEVTKYLFAVFPPLCLQVCTCRIASIQCMFFDRTRWCQHSCPVTNFKHTKDVGDHNGANLWSRSSPWYRFITPFMHPISREGCRMVDWIHLVCPQTVYWCLMDAFERVSWLYNPWSTFSKTNSEVTQKRGQEPDKKSLYKQTQQHSLGTFRT